MKLAINYSPQAEALRSAGRIQLDLYKLPDWPDLIAEATAQMPGYVHFPLNAGDGTAAGKDWETVARLRQETGTPYVNMHLLARAAQVPDLPVGSREAEHLDWVARRAIAEVDEAVRRFGAQNVMIENVIYRGPDGDIPYAYVAPEVINRVVRETGCGLLLDIGHAWISAHHLGVGARDYLAELPVDRLMELHVVGMWHDGKKWRDHMGLRDEDWDLLDWVVARIKHGDWAEPGVMAFEYGGIGPSFDWRSDPGVIATQLPRMWELVKW